MNIKCVPVQNEKLAVDDLQDVVVHASRKVRSLQNSIPVLRTHPLMCTLVGTLTFPCSIFL